MSIPYFQAAEDHRGRYSRHSRECLQLRDLQWEGVIQKYDEVDCQGAIGR